MADPVSWFVVERGWTVVGADGEELGSVDEVLGDEESDIFNGVTVLYGAVSRPRYVPAERVRAIREGVVELDIGRQAFDRLGPGGQPQA